MTPIRFYAMTLLACASLAACSSLPTQNAMLDQARSDYQQAQSSPQTRDLAGTELKQAGDALEQATEAARRHDKAEDIDHLAYVAKQRVAVAQASGQQRSAEAAVRQAESQRDKARLVARTREADTAVRSAEAAQRDAAAAQSRSEAAMQQAQSSQQEADAALARNSLLETQLKDLNAKKTERGMVITLGDVLFDTNQSQLKPGGLRSVDKLVDFLKQYPQRKVMVEGFTDNVGSESSNEALSERRADAVRSALVSRGVATDRISTHGYGEAFPVAGNDSSGGRQQNRRVEIVLSDDSGVVAPR